MLHPNLGVVPVLAVGPHFCPVPALWLWHPYSGTCSLNGRCANLGTLLDLGLSVPSNILWLKEALYHPAHSQANFMSRQQWPSSPTCATGITSFYHSGRGSGICEGEELFDRSSLMWLLKDSSLDIIFNGWDELEHLSGKPRVYMVLFPEDVTIHQI